MITLSIVIVNYNVCGFLEQCLLSVRDAVKGISHEIFVVDNASTDGSEAYISTRFPQVKYIYNTENVGFSKANNQAIAQSSGRYVLLLNPDTVVGESVLDEACHFLDEHDDAGALGVKMIDGDGKFLPESKRGFPSPWVSFCKIFGLSKLFRTLSFAVSRREQYTPSRRTLWGIHVVEAFHTRSVRSARRKLFHVRGRYRPLVPHDAYRRKKLLPASAYSSLQGREHQNRVIALCAYLLSSDVYLPAQTLSSL